jgi:hypothetical protein
VAQRGGNVAQHGGNVAHRGGNVAQRGGNVAQHGGNVAHRGGPDLLDANGVLVGRAARTPRPGFIVRPDRPIYG